MRIVSFRIENFRNLRLAECSSVPDFMLICGGNGCGKSALLEALMTAKEYAGAYGADASADRAIYEAFYPPAEYNVSFVPAGNSATVRKTAEQVNALLTASVGFQQYFSIVDGDINRAESDPTQGTRLFQLPVYHVENLLLVEDEILAVTREMLRDKCHYSTATDVQRDLEELVLSESHLNAFAGALLDAKIAEAAKEAYDVIYKGVVSESEASARPDFSGARSEALARLEDSITNGTWRECVKGRELLKAFCGKNGLTYEHFRNMLIARLKTPPKSLSDIMEKILGQKSAS
jgi:hypothetical protein